MAETQTMSQSIKQVTIEAAKAAVRTTTEAVDLVGHRNRRNAAINGPKAGRPQL